MVSLAQLRSRKRGRPIGSRDQYGRAKRFDPKWDRAYRDAIGIAVHNRRTELSISASELGAAVGLDSSCIYRIERGERNCQARTLCRIAVALDMRPSELLP